VSTPTVLIATRNPGKVREFVQIFIDVDARFVSLLDFPDVSVAEERGSSFEEIAANKAEEVCRATELISLADDSGLEIDVLDGRPGIHSNRFMGDDATDAEKNTEILRLLHNQPMVRRVCRYRCAIAVAAPHRETRTVSASCEGRIASEPRGEGGFGYDPIFFVPQLGKTMAELSPEQKNSISHRGKAARRAVSVLQRLLSNL